MPTIDETLNAAEESLRAGNPDDAYQALHPVVANLDATGKEIPSVATFTRLAKLLKDVAEKVEKVPLDQAQHVLARGIDLSPIPEGMPLRNELGRLLYDREHYDQAVKVLQPVIDSLPPLNPDILQRAWRLRAASLRELRRFEDSEESFARAFGFGTVSARTWLERGWLFFYQSKFRKAAEDFQQCLENTGANDQEKLEAMTGQIASLCAEDAGKPSDETNKLSELIASWSAAPRNVREEAIQEALATAGSTLSFLNNYAAALVAYDLILKRNDDHKDAYERKMETLKWLRRFKEVEDVFATAQKKWPADVDLWNEMGDTLFQQRRFQEAHDVFNGDAIEKRLPAEQQAAFRDKLRASIDAAEWTIITLRKMRRFPEAEQKIDDALTRFGEKANFLSERAVIHFSKQEYRQAIRVFDRVLEIDGYDQFARQWRAASYRKLRDFASGELSINDALEKLPAGTGLWEELAWIHFDQNDFAKADECFAKSTRLDPYLLQRQFSRAEVLVRLNRSEDARELLLKLKQQFPEDIEVTEQLGWFHLRRGELAYAKEEFDFIAATDPGNVLGINAMGGYYLEQRDYCAAEDAFRQAILTVDYEPQYHINLAWSLVRQIREPGQTPKPEISRRKKLFDAATESCRRALELEPQNAKAFVCLGVIAFKRNELLDAEGYFHKSVELNPAEGGYVELGALYIQMGRYPEARKELLEAIRFNRNDARAHIELGNLLLLEESNKEAVRACLQAVGSDRSNDDAHRALSIALMRAGHYHEAEKALREAIRSTVPSRKWQLHLMLSRILVRLADDNDKDRELYSEALKHINEAKRSNPNADVYFHAGIVHSKLGEYRLARRSFGDCLNEDRHHFDAYRYSKLVESIIRQERTISKGNTWGGWALSAFCLLSLIGLWGVYVRGRITTVPASGQQSSVSEAPQAAGPEKLQSLPKPKEELTVDKTMLTVMTPILLGLMVVGLLLPNLNKIKLPGGIEAEIRDVKTKETISTGPKGDISFGSSLPTVSPGPGGRS